MVKALDISGVNLQAMENGSSHKTSMYELVSTEKALVVRRGSTFNLIVTFSQRNFDPKLDQLKLVFKTGLFADHIIFLYTTDSLGSYPSVTKGTTGVAVLEPGGHFSKKGRWEAVTAGRHGGKIIISVMVPVEAPVGMWEAAIETWYGDKTWSTKTHAVEMPIYIIFNPLISADPTYMHNPAEQQEYLMEDMGKIYAGSPNALRGRPWVFGQFESTILPAACHLLDIARIKPTERSNPIRVARALSAIVNSNDNDNGVLVGRWDGKYEDGKEPFKWSGSVKILEQYMNTGGRPVRYGQCWVFAGIMTTVCRALGLPCRPVTCYSSAHDTNKSLTIDKYYDEDGEELKGIPGAPGISDSIWNFHCWNDVWMSRPDLPTGYGGWQTIDSTPQEESDNMYQLGPTSVEAVRKGEVGLGYDTAFVFTEVNADVMVFVKDPKNIIGFKRTDTNTTHIGRLLVTKAVGQNSDDPRAKDWEDITTLYKNKEGTLSERLSVMNAIRGCGSSCLSLYDFPSSSQQDLFLQIVDLDKGVFGKPYKVSVFLHNQSSKERTVKVVLSSSSVFYTGVKAHLVKKGSGEFTMAANERETLSMEVAPDEYMSKVVDMCIMKNYVLVSVAQTGQTWSSEDDFVLEKPSLDVRVMENPRVGRVFSIQVSFTNPLNIELTKCNFNLEAPGVVRAHEIKFRSIKPAENVEAVIPLLPRNRGKSTLMVVFNALELFDITGTRKITVL